MHVPDGFLDATTSLATGAVAAGAVGWSLQRAEREVREAGAPLAGLTAAFVFAAQMVTFPVGPGTSGHLLGGALAAVLVGPWTAVLCLTVVLVVQALLFADGGLTALGTNVTLVGVVTVLVGYAVAAAVVRVLPARASSVVPAAVAGAFCSVPAVAAAFVGLYAVGGAVEVPLGTLAAAMLAWHVVIGAGEAAITGAVVATVVATRPDLVHLARRRRPDLVLHGPDGTTTVRADVPDAGRPSARPLAAAGAVTLLTAGLAGLVASAAPDGLERVAQATGLAAAARDSALAGSPLADYAAAGAGGPVGTAVAGLVGVAVVLAAGLAVTRAVTARRARPDPVPSRRGA